MKPIPRSFFTRPDTELIARELLGKHLVTQFEGIRTAGMIVETEAYLGPDDKASHAYRNRRTKRTEIMFCKGGTAYVYFIYGIYHLFNVVTNEVEQPFAVLIRAIEPQEGIEEMLIRRKKSKLDYSLTSGPGTLSQALGIHKGHSGLDLMGGTVYLEDNGLVLSENEIISSPRVGVDYAGDHAAWPLRFRIKNNPWTSKAK